MTPGYIFKRASETLITVFFVITLTFIFLRALPGGPFDGEEGISLEQKRQQEAFFNLDQPMVIQYFNYLKNALMFNFGQSFRYANKNVSEVMADALWPTLEISLVSLFSAYLIGIPLGLFSVYLYKTRWDGVAVFFISSGICLPAFLVGPILILVFSLKLDWFAPALLEGPASFVLPVMTLGLRPLALVTRLIRASAVEITKSDFVRAARARGLSETKIYFKHILKNSLVPLLSISGSLGASIISGTFIVELLFAIPGLGNVLVDGVINRDYSLVIALAIFYTLLLVLLNLMMDLVLIKVDGRIVIK